MIPFVLHPHIEADSIFVRDLVLSQVRLQNQSLLPWLLLVPRRAETEIFQLSAPDRARLMEEITLASQVITKAFQPDKINVGALGNLVPQLHVHVIGRYHKDPAWPDPVWGRLTASPYLLADLDEKLRVLKDENLWSQN